MDVWNWVPLRNGTLVENTVVSAGSPVTSSLLRHHVQGRGPSTR